ncbi:MAG: phosphoglycerate kinase [Minisyncoccus archaeiphilus]|jgi:phosphoglycerate kinase|uniref:phosphoglycerate kinase n=1 Tax=Minisyncoccus archaeiphilus TaxID=3238481 RepID=UPI0009C6EC23|nr:MAG: Phosphoglycerate kinase [Parcubacteria group bacterium ADurb.Bin216]GMX59795.1 MAG: phosphoglycerate kinase [Candidatus Parcubacteria bacterium]
MKNLREADINGKRVLVRCDFNVPVYDDGSIADKFRINQALPTIEYLRSNNAKVVLISHLGRPEGKDKKFSLKKVAEYLDEKIGGVKFYGDCIGRGVEKEVGNMKEGEVLLLENLRFYKEEEANDLVFSEKLAGLADIFVQEGFSVCHREHASVVGVAKLIPAYPGFLLEKEVNVLRKALENPERPLVSIVGGVKLETKIKLLEKLLEVSDYVLVGGKIANTILVLKGICVKDNWSKEESGLADVVSRIDLTSTKLHLPLDGVIALKDLEQKYMRVGAVGTLKNDESIYDIGPDTVEKFKAIIKEAGTIIWNGPMGYSEIEAFENGTKEIMQAVADNEGFAILGGGETAEAVAKFKIEDKFEHVSTGGGAMLDFISGDNLPGISILD